MSGSSRAAAAAALWLGFGLIAAAPAPAPAPNPVVARVEGTEIRASALDTAWEALPAQFHAMPKAQLRAPLLDQLIDRRLASLAAEKQGLAADPRVMRELAQAREDVMQGAYLRAYTAQRITDAAVRARYQAQLKAFKPEPQVRARHILAKDEAAIRGAAERLKKGEAFEAVAKQISVDGSASEGGELGTFTADKMVPEFSEVAFKLGAGQVSQPFKSRFGWHIVQVEDKGMTKAPPFAALEKELKSQMAGEMVESALAALRKSAKIERTADAPKAPATH